MDNKSTYHQPYTRSAIHSVVKLTQLKCVHKIAIIVYNRNLVFVKNERHIFREVEYEL
jgi:hypothetical protein